MLLARVRGRRRRVRAARHLHVPARHTRRVPLVHRSSRRRQSRASAIRRDRQPAPEQPADLSVVRAGEDRAARHRASEVAVAYPYVGEIRMFAGNFAPAGWMFCEGQTLAISENDTLFTLIGTTYGGDGQTTFNLPDLRGRLPLHMGQGSGLAKRGGGENGGGEGETLATSQIPAHSHVPEAHSGRGNQ